MTIATEPLVGLSGHPEPRLEPPPAGSRPPTFGRRSKKLPSRPLIRTASSVLSLPDRGSAVETAIRELWDDLQIVDVAGSVSASMQQPLTRVSRRPCRSRMLAGKHARGAMAEVSEAAIEALAKSFADQDGFDWQIEFKPINLPGTKIGLKPLLKEADRETYLVRARQRLERGKGIA
jgi:hypothetical protein